MTKKSGTRSPTCTLSCPCGAPVIVDRSHPEGVQECVVCRQNLRIIIARDPKTRRRRIGILVAPQAITTATKAVKPAKPASKREATKRRAPAALSLAGVHNPKCACGAQVPVNLSAVDAVYTCPWCGACYTAVSKADEKTGTVIALLMPVAAAPIEKPAAKKAPKSEGAFHMTPQVIGAQPLRTREGAVWMSCFCGGEMKIDPEVSQQERNCPGCGLFFQLVLAVEPGTHQPMVISLPRSKAAAKETAKEKTA